MKFYILEAHEIYDIYNKKGLLETEEKTYFI